MIYSQTDVYLSPVIITVARHMSERLSNTIVFTGIGFLLDSIGIPLTELITTLFLELPGSRKQEVEADMLGIKFMAKACYDPKAAIECVSLSPSCVDL